MNPSEVIPSPLEECFHLRPHGGQQDRVNSKPCCEGEDAGDDMVIRSNFGHRSVSAHHRHGALVEVCKGALLLTFGCSGDVVCAMPSRRLRDGSELRERLSADKLLHYLRAAEGQDRKLFNIQKNPGSSNCARYFGELSADV